jgi:DNA primase
MAIPQAFIDELLSRLDIVELIDQRIPLRKRGSNYIAPCPFHNEKTPSFTVSQSKQIYHCFGCGAGGNAISFLMNYERLSFTESIEQLALAFNIPLPEQNKPIGKTATNDSLYEVLANASQYYQQQLRHHPEAIAYLKQRGFTGAIAKTFGLGYAPNAWDNVSKALSDRPMQLLDCGLLVKTDKGKLYDRFRGRIMFPIRNQRGKTIGFGGRIIEQGEPKYLNSPETKVFHKGTELYGLYEACQATRHLSRLVIVEGYLDVLALAQHDISYAVATLGTATTPDHLKKLFRHTTELVFCFDGDTAGQAAAWKALEIALPFMEDGRQIRFLLLPQGHDPDSYVRTLEPGVFAKQIASAMPLEDFLFGRLSQQIDIGSPAGKAQLVKQIGERLDLLPPGSLRPILIEQLAKTLRVNSNAVQQMLQSSRKPLKRSDYAENKQQKAKIIQQSPSLVRHAIAILLQYPKLAARMQSLPQLDSTVSKGLGFLQELLQLLKLNPNFTTGAIIEHWREHNFHKYLKNLATHPLNGTAEDLYKELDNAFSRLIEEQQFQALWNKYRQGQLSPTEKNQLYQMLKSQHHS